MHRFDIIFTMFFMYFARGGEEVKNKKDIRKYTNIKVNIV